MLGWSWWMLLSVSAGASSVEVREGLVVQRFSVEDGLPLAHAADLTLGSDGTLWVATVEGLVRFDGVRFQPVEESWYDVLGTRRVARAFQEPAGSAGGSPGRLWLMGQDARLAWYDGQTLRPGPDLPGQVGRPLTWSWLDHQLWVLTESGHYRLGERPSAVPWAPLRGGSRGIAKAPDGEWLYGDPSSVYLQEEAGGSRLLGPEEGLPQGEVHWIGMDEEGWPVVIVDEQALRWTGLRFAPHPTLQPPHSRCWRGARRRDGACLPANPGPVPPAGAGWATTEAGVWLGDRLVYPTRYFPETSLVDAEGGLWVATQGEGLLHLRPSLLQVLTLPGQADRRVDLLFLDHLDRLWLRQARQGVWWVADSEARRGGRGAVRASQELEDLWPDERALVSGAGQAASDRDRSVWRAQGHPPEWVVRATDRAGGVWLGGRAGLARWDRHGLRPVPGLPDNVRSVLALDAGPLVVGSRLHGLWWWNLEDPPVAVPGPPGVGVRHLQDDGELLWVSTDQEGLCGVGPLSAPPSSWTWKCLRPGGQLRTVHASASDDAGRRWVSTNAGLWVAREEQLRGWWAGDSPEPLLLQLGHTAGMPNAEGNGFNGSTFASDRSGVLWFATQDGVVGVEPWRFQLPVPTKVLLGAVGYGEGVHLAPDAALHLRWAAPDPLWGPQVVFQTRLNGGPWSPAGTERELHLAALPPGPFRFEVQAGLAGRWGPTAALEGFRDRRWQESPWAWLAGLAVSSWLVVALVRRRTQRMRARQIELEEQVRERTSALQDTADRLMERTRQLGVQSERLALLESARTRSIVNLHHEVRTPLTLVLGGLARLPPPTEDRAREALELAQRNAERLASLVTQLGALARVEAGEVVPRPRPARVEDSLKVVLQRFAGLARERRVLLELQVGPDPAALSEVWWVDPDLFDTLLGNLLHNALKFTPAGGTVSVLVFRAGEFLEVQVQDTGPGVPEEERGRVFERLYQVQQGDDRPHEGSGIGLALVQELVELCGGKYGLKPRLPMGSIFWFALPAGTAHLLPADLERSEPGALAPARPEPASAEGPEGAPLVLVVEDHDDMRAWIQGELSEAYRVLGASGGEHALRLLTLHQPELVVSDVMMPGLDGLNLTRQLLERDGQLRVLLVSARAVDLGAEGLPANQVQFLAKPFSGQQLRERVWSWIGGWTSGRDTEQAVQTSTPTEGDRRLLERLTAELDRRLADETLDVPTLARAVGLSERTLYRELARLMGVSPARWVREHRLQRAEEMLDRGVYRTVSEVAAAVGMSRAWFSRAYRAYRGVAPGERLGRPEGSEA